MDLRSERDRIFDLAQDVLEKLESEYAGQITRLDEQVWNFDYPSLVWPKKIATHNFDKQPVVEGILQAIKGQYLIFDTGCLNVRKFTSYQVSISSESSGQL
jgi:hypothetical protein